MKQVLVHILFLICFFNFGIAQENKPLFIGLQPGITSEQFYEEDEMDVNAIPIVLEFPWSKRIDLRFTTIGNYHFGGEENGFSDIGFQALALIFLKKKKTTNEISSGFYIAPVGGYGRNLIYEHGTFLLAVEGGYLFPTNKYFTLSLGVQFGGSYFDYDNEQDLWRQHFGFKLNLGFWVKIK